MPGTLAHFSPDDEPEQLGRCGLIGAGEGEHDAHVALAGDDHEAAFHSSGA